MAVKSQLAVYRRRTPVASRATASPSESGFSLIELMVLLGVVGIVLAIGVPKLLDFVVRSRTESFIRDSTILMQRARFEAIKLNRQGMVYVDGAQRRLVGFVDRDNDRALGAADMRVGSVSFPNELSQGGPPSDSAATLGFTDVGGEKWVVFRSDGTAVDAGAYRFVDLRGNYLEVRIDRPATGRIGIRKWQNGKWLPPPAPESGQTWEAWEWK